MGRVLGGEWRWDPEARVRYTQEELDESKLFIEDLLMHLQTRTYAAKESFSDV